MGKLTHHDIARLVESGELTEEQRWALADVLRTIGYFGTKEPPLDLDERTRREAAMWGVVVQDFDKFVETLG